MANADLMTLEKLFSDNKSFFVPTYQRGYRWTGEQVKKLIEDLYDFVLKRDINDPKDIYCLQPIIVKKRTGSTQWELIDGQQRLTTIALLYAVHCALNSASGTPVACTPAYKIFYDGKEKLTDLFGKITGFNGSVQDFQNLPNTDLSTIDCDYMLKSLKVILSFETESQTIDKVLSAIFGSEQFIDIIWYELDDEDSINTFSNINANNINLTDAELIKALLLNSLSNGIEDDGQKVKIQKISLQWEEIEKGLNDDNLWSFMSDKNRDRYDTRIDYLFEIWCAINGLAVDEKEDHPLFNQIEKKIKAASNTGKEKEALTIWKDILSIYETMNDWYNDFEYYHLIGLFIIVAHNKDAQNIKDLFASYNDVNMTKSGFKRTLRSKIREEIFFVKTQSAPKSENQYALLLKKDSGLSKQANNILEQLRLGADADAFYEEMIRLAQEKDKWREYRTKKKNPQTLTIDPDAVETLYNELLLEEAIGALSYKNDGHEVRNVLLLYNIAMLVNEKKGYETFPFGRYKYDKWDIEHINPQTPLEATDEEKREWLYSYRGLLEGLTTDQVTSLDSNPNNKLSRDSILKEIKDSLRDSDYSKLGVIGKDVERYFDIQGTDGFGNLVLLDEFTNRHYHNDCFLRKREEIVKVERGELGTKRDSEGHGKAYIPIGTRWVFLKAYEGMNSLIVWGAKDQDSYKTDVARTIIKMLGNIV